MQIERDFASYLGAGEFDRMRKGLQEIADRIDTVGAFGTGDASD